MLQAALDRLQPERPDPSAPDAATQAIFDQGHEVGALAKQLYPGGIEVIAGVTDFQQVIQQSLEAAKPRRGTAEPVDSIDHRSCVAYPPLQS